MYNCPLVYIYSISLLAMITLSAVQLTIQTFIHNVILFVDISNNASYIQVHWLMGTSYLLKITSNVPDYKFWWSFIFLFCERYLISQ